MASKGIIAIARFFGQVDDGNKTATGSGKEDHDHGKLTFNQGWGTLLLLILPPPALAWLFHFGITVLLRRWGINEVKEILNMNQLVRVLPPFEKNIRGLRHDSRGLFKP